MLRKSQSRAVPHVIAPLKRNRSRRREDFPQQCLVLGVQLPPEDGCRAATARFSGRVAAENRAGPRGESLKLPRHSRTL